MEESSNASVLVERSVAVRPGRPGRALSPPGQAFGPGREQHAVPGGRADLFAEDRFLKIVESPWHQVLCGVQDIVSTASMDFFRSRGLKTVHVPITTHSISSPMGLGSDSKPVEIDLFGVQTNLADSMQFMLEYACRFPGSGAYYLMPSFRGEDADESHLCQFYHSEAEIRGGLDDVISLVEGYLGHLCAELHEHVGEGIASVAGTLDHVNRLAGRTTPLPRIRFREAVELLRGDSQYVRELSSGALTLTRAGEARLIAHFEGYLWVTHFDHLSVPFYQAFAPDGSALAADLLMGIGETVGAGERHVSSQEVEQALALHEVGADPYGWYLRMKERYPLRTAGFGLGVERFICWLLKHGDIRDCQLAPRANGVHSVP